MNIFVTLYFVKLIFENFAEFGYGLIYGTVRIVRVDNKPWCILGIGIFYHTLKSVLVGIEISVVPPVI